MAYFLRLLAIFVLANLATKSWGQTSSTTDRGLKRSDYERVLTAPGDENAFQDFLDKLPKIALRDGEVTRNFYILEGDLLMTAQQVRAFVYSHAFGTPQSTTQQSSGELLVMADPWGRPVFWPRGNRNLTYAIDQRSFSPPAYQLVVQNMAAAATAWLQACPQCNVVFQHRQEFDANPSLNNVTFIVGFNPNVSQFIAASFFPNDPIFRRYLVIGPQYFTTSFSKVGVLRHEIGHILGYRHQHIVGVPGCQMEDNQWIPLTPHDPRSVMHYFCGGGGTMDLQLTTLDIEGHTRLYQ